MILSEKKKDGIILQEKKISALIHRITLKIRVIFIV